MNRPPLTTLLLILLFSLFLTHSPRTVGAGTSQELYHRAVGQLNQEGFAGIDRALEAFEELIQKDPAFLPAYLSAADAYLLKYEFTEKKDKGWLEKGKNLLNAAVGQNSRLAPAYFKRSVLYFNLEESDKAAADLQKAMEIDPAYLDARVLYLQYLLSAQKKEEAQRFAEASLRLFPKNPAPLKSFGDVFFQEGAYAKAIEFYQAVLPLVPKAPHTYLALGKAHQQLKQYPRAVNAFQKALTQNPELVEAHFNLSYCLSESGKLQEAIGHLEAYLKKIPRDVSALNNLALLYEQAGQETKARLLWLKVKEAAEDPAYKQRAEQHLYRLLTQKEDPNKKLPGPSQAPKEIKKTGEKKR